MELLAPAGSWDAFTAAVNNGADAVYLGGQFFSARHSAENFSLEQIKRAVEYAHIRTAKVYVTVNTLLNSGEFASALDYIFRLYQADVDAIIIQDLGLLKAVRELLPDLRLHASTQMTVHNSEGVTFLQQQGIKRIVLARELSFEDIRMIKAHNDSVELEVFVHGALCYCYSGQCLFSSMVGGRSGNRGRCAQPCRLPYTLHSDRQGKLETQGRHLLSPSDLALIDHLPKLNEIGIHSLKIEGRMKRSEYVAIVTRSYRQVLDHLQEFSGTDTEILKSQMMRIFNRTFTTGYADTSLLRRLSIQRPNNRGVNIGRIVSHQQDGKTQIRLQHELSIGDGLEVWVSRGKGPALVVDKMEVGGRDVDEAHPGDIVTISIPELVSENDRVFKTHDEKLMASARGSIDDAGEQVIDIDIEVKGKYGHPLEITYLAEQGIKAAVQTRNAADRADQKPLDEEVLRDKLGRLGNTPFKLRNLTFEADEQLIVPFSDINQARREAVEHLLQELAVWNHRHIAEPFFIKRQAELLVKETARPKARSTIPQLRVMVSSPEAGMTALGSGADRIYLHLSGMGNHRRPSPEDILRLSSECEKQGCELIPALPHIHKPTDAFDYTSLLEQTGFKRAMIGDLGYLHWCRQNGWDFYADYTLNVFNTLALAYLQQLGAQGACLSPELSLMQLKDFPDLSKVELLVYGELVLMTSQTCVLYEVLGEEARCSKHCLRDNYHLTDDKGYSFPVRGDADCRFYVFNSRTLSMLDDLYKLTALSPAGVRLELLKSPTGQVKQVVQLFRAALDDIASGHKPNESELKQRLEKLSSSPLTKGHYFRGVE